jgi:hypothetical protein
LRWAFLCNSLLSRASRAGTTINAKTAGRGSVSVLYWHPSLHTALAGANSPSAPIAVFARGSRQFPRPLPPVLPRPNRLSASSRRCSPAPEHSHEVAPSMWSLLLPGPGLCGRACWRARLPPSAWAISVLSAQLWMLPHGSAIQPRWCQPCDHRRQDRKGFFRDIPADKEASW